MQNEAFDFTRRLLQWRKGNEVISKGSLKHFSIASGTYVYERRYGDRSVVVIMNGTNEAQTLKLEPYREVLPRPEATDFLSGKALQLREEISLQPREMLLLTF